MAKYYSASRSSSLAVFSLICSWAREALCVPLPKGSAVVTSLCWSQASSPFRTYFAKACFRYGPRIGAFLPTYVVAMLEVDVEAFKRCALRTLQLQEPEVGPESLALRTNNLRTRSAKKRSCESTDKLSWTG